MNIFADLFVRGWSFARNNPQIIYTLFLVFAIPLAFFFSSDQFLSIARENQDRLEQSRIALLEDALSAFLPSVKDSSELSQKLALLAKQNETINSIDIVTSSSSVSGLEYHLYASLHGTSTEVYVPDQVAQNLLRFAPTDTERSFAMAYSDQEGRHWRSVRALPTIEGALGYVLVDVSMAESDALSRRNIDRAYLVLGLIILLIIILLARQARIIDYSVLYSRLKEVDRMKDDFVSMAAHELRSPLTVIRGYVEMLGEGEGLSEAGKVHLKNIDRSALALSTLIGDILDVAKLQEGRMSFKMESIDPHPMIDEIIGDYRKPAETKGLLLTKDFSTTPVLISVDAARLRQVVTNLVGNAIKYTPKGSVRIATTIDKGEFAIRVSDTGMGIGAEDQKRIFEKFFRVKSDETKQIEGTGLGLWISAAIVTKMGGSIDLESIKGKGTDFIVSFKIAK